MGLSVPWFDKPVPTPDYAALRVGYTSQPLRQADMAPDPLTQFQAWFTDALAAELLEPNAMTLATALPCPSSSVSHSTPLVSTQS